VERSLQVEDGLTVLDGHDATGGEAPSVADAVDVVHHRDLRVAQLEEVRVHRVHPPFDVDGAPGRHQGLG
jgi:hypothetical protein